MNWHACSWRQTTPRSSPGARRGHPRGLTLLVELAELLQAPVQDGKQFVQRMNFPSRHPLRGGNVAEADLVLGLEMPDFFQQIHTLTPINRFGMESGVRPSRARRSRPSRRTSC